MQWAAVVLLLKARTAKRERDDLNAIENEGKFLHKDLEYDRTERISMLGVTAREMLERIIANEK